MEDSLSRIAHWRTTRYYATQAFEKKQKILKYTNRSPEDSVIIGNASVQSMALNEDKTNSTLEQKDDHIVKVIDKVPPNGNSKNEDVWLYLVCFVVIVGTLRILSVYCRKN